MTTRPLIAEKVQVYLNLWQNIPASQFIYDHSKHFPDEFIVLITSSKSHLIQHDDRFCKLLFDGGIFAFFGLSVRLRLMMSDDVFFKLKHQDLRNLSDVTVTICICFIYILKA